MSDEREDYIPGFHFSVIIEDNDKATDTKFQEVSGLSATLSVEEVAEGGENRYLHKLPKPPTYPNLVLKRSLSSHKSDLIKWAKKCIQEFSISTKQITVQLLNKEHEALKSWTLHNAYPVKMELSGFNAQQSQLVIETMEICYSHFREGPINDVKKDARDFVKTSTKVAQTANKALKYGEKAIKKIF